MVDFHECSLAFVPFIDSEHENAPANPDPSSIPADAWEHFETAALAVVGRIQPTVSSESRRAAVVNYVQRLVRCTVGCEVFPFGSVPLKTYLPDGDIDLTAFGSTSSDESLANEVRAILESEGVRTDAEFEVKDVQYIHAEVKLVKCLVQNIVVDISFNQIGGLCTLCFLEQVDARFEKNHLLKRSIMLIKTWCYYESRILGAHHGLISTYALEILVLYIFHLFHDSLDGPLAVLYRFLDYYSKFDWDNKGISLYGPVSLPSLPELVTDQPATHDDGFLQRVEFLKQCAQMFTVPPRNSEKNTGVFSPKFLNIVDPLKQSNNLGRSINKGNFKRIRSAFDLGARKLGKILQLPASSTVDEVNQFFKNTLKRNHTRVRPDVQDMTVDFNIARDKDCSPLHSNSFGDLSDQFNNISISDSNNHGSLKHTEQNSTAEHKEMKSASNLVTTHSFSTRNEGVLCEAALSTSGTCSLPCGKANYGPHISYKSETAKVDVKYPGTPTNRYKEVGSNGGAASDNLSDLAGDYRTNFNNLLYSQGCLPVYPMNQEYPVNQVYYRLLPPPPPPYQNKRSPNGHNRKYEYGFPSTNGLVPGPYSPGHVAIKPFYQADDPMRYPGIGTYFRDPNLSMEMPPSGRGGRGRNHFPPNNFGRYHRYGRGMPAEMTHSEEFRHEAPLQVYIPVANDHGVPSPLTIPSPSPSSRVRRDIIHDNGFIHPEDSKLEFGTLGALPLQVTSASQDQANKASPVPNSQPSAPPISPAQNPGTGSKSNRMRANHQPYHLKDNGDFPPLSS